MNLDVEECWRRFVHERRAVFSTVHATRGVDTVPVVFAVTDDHRIVIPVDTVKAKTTTELQRRDNLRADPRCVLLVDHYEDDWSKLWWVRVHGHGVETELGPELLDVLAARYPPYAEPGAVAAAIVVTPERVTGWAA